MNKAFGPSNKEIKETIDIYNAIDRGRNADLQYQMNLEALQKRRDDAARERDLESRIPQLIDQINGIRGSDGDTTTKAQALTDLQLKNPYLANTSL